jgi:hypothetical protein
VIINFLGLKKTNFTGLNNFIMTELIVMYFKAFVLTQQSFCWHSSKLRQKEGRQYKSSDVIQPKDRKERKGKTVFYILYLFLSLGGLRKREMA